MSAFSTVVIREICCQFEHWDLFLAAWDVDGTIHSKILLSPELYILLSASWGNYTVFLRYTWGTSLCDSSSYTTSHVL